MCELLRSTGYVAGGKRPAGYPESLFARVSIPANVVTKLLGRLRSDDLYHLLTQYPETNERSTGLANQVLALFSKCSSIGRNV